MDTLLERKIGHCSNCLHQRDEHISSSGPVNMFWDGRARLVGSGNATVWIQTTHSSWY